MTIRHSSVHVYKLVGLNSVDKTLKIGGLFKEGACFYTSTKKAVERCCSNTLADSSNTFTLCNPVILTFDILT